MITLTPVLVRFGLIIFAVLIATFLIGIRREDKSLTNKVFSADTLRQILAFFIMAGVLCSLSDDSAIFRKPTPINGLELLFAAFPIVGGGILFFAGAYSFRCGMYKRTDKIRAGRALLFFFPMLFFASVINSSNYAIPAFSGNWSLTAITVLVRPYMGLIPLMLILELVLYVSHKIFRDEKKVIFAAGVVCIVLEFLSQSKDCWRVYPVMFFFGILLIRYEDILADLIRKKLVIIFPSALLLFAGTVFQEIWYMTVKYKKFISPFARDIPFEGHMYVHERSIGVYGFDQLMMLIASVALVTVFLCLAVKLRVSNPVYRFLSGFVYEFSWVSVLAAYALNNTFLNKRTVMNFDSYILDRDINMIRVDLVTGSYLRYQDLVIYILLVIAFSAVVSFIIYNPFRILKARKEQ